jgi:hypothetical protein
MVRQSTIKQDGLSATDRRRDSARVIAALKGEAQDMPMLRGTASVVAIGLAALSLATAARADDARTARLRVLCAQISGGDFADPGSMAAFQRCLHARDPVAAMRRNVVPPRHPIPGLVARTGVPLTANASGGGSSGCGPGLVWRRATPGDRRCVSRQVHAATAFDNAHAGSRVAGPNGACKAGYVWRESTPADHVCVTPATRASAR